MTVDIGDEAPDFELTDQHTQPVRLSDHRGRKAVALVFFPLAFSPVCTGELSGVRDDLASFQSEDVQVLAVSVDSPFALGAFAEREGYEFPLLSDMWPHGEVARRYGVFNEDMGVARRGTFVIDPDGVVTWKVVNNVPDARDLDAIRAALAEAA
jgi:peroxiredoxin